MVFVVCVFLEYVVVGCARGWFGDVVRALFVEVILFSVVWFVLWFVLYEEVVCVFVESFGKEVCVVFDVDDVCVRVEVVELVEVVFLYVFCNVVDHGIEWFEVCRDVGKMFEVSICVLVW